MDVPTKRLDELWRSAIRARDGSRCQYRQCRNSGTAAHHIFSRRHRATRWDPENGILLCFFCHIRIAHEDPEIFRDFLVTEWFTPEKFAALKMRAQAIAQRADHQLIELMLRGFILAGNQSGECRRFLDVRSVRRDPLFRKAEALCK